LHAILVTNAILLFISLALFVAHHPHCHHHRSFAVSLLLNLEAAQQGRSVLFSDEQKLLFKGGKKGFVKNTKLDFMRC
jgi:hypothetical protein